MFVVDHPSVEQNDDFLWKVAFPFKMTSLFFHSVTFLGKLSLAVFRKSSSPPWFSQKNGEQTFVSSTKTPVFPMICWYFVKKQQRLKNNNTRGTRAMLPEPLPLPEMWTRMGARRLGASSGLVPPKMVFSIELAHKKSGLINIKNMMIEMCGNLTGCNWLRTFNDHIYNVLYGLTLSRGIRQLSLDPPSISWAMMSFRGIPNILAIVTVGNSYEPVFQPTTGMVTQLGDSCESKPHPGEHDSW